jgi:hypothetical protein
MSGEFKERIRLLGLDDASEKKVIDLIQEAGKQYSCLACPSKDTCENFKWYVKWFSE